MEDECTESADFDGIFNATFCHFKALETSISMYEVNSKHLFHSRGWQTRCICAACECYCTALSICAVQDVL